MVIADADAGEDYLVQTGLGCEGIGAVTFNFLSAELTFRK
jgi:hypothetical protein